MGAVIAILPDEAALTAAWEAYDAAQLGVVALYRNPSSTSAERRAAITEAMRLHREFARLFHRAEIGR